MTRTPLALGLSASPSPQSRSRELLGAALERFARSGLGVERVDLSRLSAEALLGRVTDRELEEALAWVQSARILVIATPVYRATYSGLLKVFFDLLPHGALAGTIVVPIATGGSSAHQLALDHGLRPLVASLGGVTVATGIYANPDQFPEGKAEPSLLARVHRAAEEALELASSAPSPLSTLATH